MYSNNLVRIAWGGVLSDYFSAINGVKQGDVLSPVLYCVYIDDLLLALSKSGVGCYIGSNVVGALAYAVDVVLIAPTATAMRKLLFISGEYATEYCISFNASKSKCLAVLPANRRELNRYLNECRLTVNDQPIELVQCFQHLGHTITSQLNDVSDIIAKQYAFIGQTMCSVFFQEANFVC
jgi:Reverse transcriptase (RNA-dependent DNA polymerase)